MNRECFLNRACPDADFLGYRRRRCSAFYPATGNLNDFQCQSYSCSMDNQFRYLPVNGNYRLQDFQYFVVMDFEATCDKEKIPHPQEIIEFPSVIVNSITGEIEDCFQTYVRPTYNQQLTDFCKDLTGIQQNQVDRGVTLSEALLNHDKWLDEKGINNTNFAVVTWSDWDCQVMLESECKYKKIGKPSYFNRWITLKIPFGEVFGGIRCNLKQALETAGLSWWGRAHCGLDDAKNTARLLALLMRRGVKFSITASLPDDSFTWKQHLEKKQHYQKLRALHCFCGIRSSKGMVRKPGSEQWSLSFCCGNWAAAGYAHCNYFLLVSP